MKRADMLKNARAKAGKDIANWPTVDVKSQPSAKMCIRRLRAIMVHRLAEREFTVDQASIFARSLSILEEILEMSDGVINGKNG